MTFVVTFMDERAGKVKAQQFNNKHEAEDAALAAAAFYPEADFEEFEVEGAITALVDHNSASNICVVESGDSLV